MKVQLGKFLGRSFKAILKGEFLLRMQVDKVFPHILWFFALMWVSIWLSMKIDATLIRVEQNKRILGDLEIYHAEKTEALVRLNRFSTIQYKLEEMGSKVGLPEKPATVLKKK